MPKTVFRVGTEVPKINNQSYFHCEGTWLDQLKHQRGFTMFHFWKWHKMEAVSIHPMEINYLRSSYWQSQWNCNIGEISVSVQKLIEYPVKPLDLDPDNIKIHRLDKDEVKKPRNSMSFLQKCSFVRKFAFRYLGIWKVYPAILFLPKLEVCLLAKLTSYIKATNVEDNYFSMSSCCISFVAFCYFSQ